MNDFDSYAQRYAQDYERGSFETHLVEVRRRHVLQSLKRHGARRVLEVGCGLEPLFPYWSQFETWHVVEPAQLFAASARDLADDSRITVVEGRMEEQVELLASERFDFVITSSVVHEVADPVSFLRAVRALCDDKTVVHVNVPNVRSFHRLLAVEMGLVADVSTPSDRDRAFGHERSYDMKALVELLDSAGFVVFESGTWFVKPFTHDQMDALLATGAFPPALLVGLDGMIRHLPELGVELYANVRRA